MESVNHPAHYNTGKLEVIEIIEDQGLGFHLGNAVKYICRAGRKDPTRYIEDLKKAIWYIERRIEIEKESPRRPNDMNPKENPTKRACRNVICGNQPADGSTLCYPCERNLGN